MNFVFFQAGAGEQYREQALENVRNNINFIDAFSVDIGTWVRAELDSIGGGNTGGSTDSTTTEGGGGGDTTTDGAITHGGAPFVMCSLLGTVVVLLNA